jgi:putative flavoprotein involved in K+ transport
VPRPTDVVIVGAGHSGLACSYELAARGIDHVILERGEVANAWRNERWESLRLLTPNWQSRLPGSAFATDDPDGFMTMPEVVDFVAGYARSTGAPVRSGATVTAVTPTGGGFIVTSTIGRWHCRAIVAASGAFSVPRLPAAAASLPAGIAGISSIDYKRPEQLDAGGVLVVGGSATGLQLADELQRSGRQVTLAVGEHVRMPRRYRGRDIQWWLTATGVLDQPWTDVDDIERARRVPSPQLVGTRGHETLDLNVLRSRGVHIAGRLAGIEDGRARFSGSLANVCALADLKLGRLLEACDQWAAVAGMDPLLGAAERPVPTTVDPEPMLTLDLAAERIRSIVWATGLSPDFGWLHVPAFDRKGRLRHDGGVVDVPGLYVLGLPFLRRRKSSYIHGAGDDARELANHLREFLDRDRRACA